MYAVDPDAEAAPDIWQALADPTRRALIDRLAGGARTTSQLCEGMPMTRFGVMKHLGILERAGLVIARRHGRLRLNHLNAAPLRALHARWLSARADALADAALGLADQLGDTDMANDNQAGATGVVDVALEWPVAASVQRVWQALFEQPETWWPAAHRAVGGGAAMTLRGEARRPIARGERRWRRAGLVRGHRDRADALGRSRRPSRRPLWRPGLLAAPYRDRAGREEGTSILKLTNSVFGRIGPELRASLTEGWQAIVGEGLVAHLELTAKASSSIE